MYNLAAVAHDLRTPLASIRLIVDYLLTEKDQDVEHFLRMIEDEVIRMSEMLENLMEKARLDSGFMQAQWSTVGAEMVCHEAVDVVRPLALSKRLNVNIDVKPTDLAFNCDHQSMRRLLVNLLSNAVRHTSAGRITVGVRERASCGNREILFQVCDTGEGMDQHTLTRLGKPFASAAAQSGLCRAGLGLAICDSIVAVHGGRMLVESSPDHGTVFSVTLPADLAGPA